MPTHVLHCHPSHPSHFICMTCICKDGECRLRSENPSSVHVIFKYKRQFGGSFSLTSKHLHCFSMNNLPQLRKGLLCTLFLFVGLVLGFKTH